MSESAAFRASAEAAQHLWEQWLTTARSHVYRDQIPSLLEMQTICRETGCILPELESFTNVMDSRPAFFVCGGNAEIANLVAAALHLPASFVDVPDSATLWWVEPAREDRIVLRRGLTEHEIPLKAVEAIFSQAVPASEILEIEERCTSSASWRLVWAPHPKYIQTNDGNARTFPALLAQRAALLVSDDVPDSLRIIFEELGQKLWEVARRDVSTGDDKSKLANEVATVLEDRPEDLELRASATWRWLSVRLLEQISVRRQAFQQAFHRHESYVATTRHLLSQYQKNWTGGLRALIEKFVQGRLTNPAVTALLDPQKPGPRPESFIAALGLPALQGHVDELLTDQMAALVAGLSGLSTKLELRRISIGDTDTHWSLRPISSKLEALLKEKRVFPADTGKRGGIVGNLTGKKQAILDERRTQVSKAIRMSVQLIEHEFVEWSSVLVASLERNIIIQLEAALANKGLPDPEVLKTATGGLDRLEKAIRGKREGLRSPEATVAEWLHRVTNSHCIPLYETPLSPAP